MGWVFAVVGCVGVVLCGILTGFGGVVFCWWGGVGLY